MISPVGLEVLYLPRCPFALVNRSALSAEDTRPALRGPVRETEDDEPADALVTVLHAIVQTAGDRVESEVVGSRDVGSIPTRSHIPA